MFAEGDGQKGGYVRHDAIADEALIVFRAAYPNAFEGSNGRTIEQAKADGLSAKIIGTNERFEVAKVDIFYYIYGILHSPECRERFAANLTKELPRIPPSRNFREFAGAGRALAKVAPGLRGCRFLAGEGGRRLPFAWAGEEDEVGQAQGP